MNQHKKIVLGYLETVNINSLDKLFSIFGEVAIQGHTMNSNSATDFLSWLHFVIEKDFKEKHQE